MLVLILVPSRGISPWVGVGVPLAPLRTFAAATPSSLPTLLFPDRTDKRKMPHLLVGHFLLYPHGESNPGCRNENPES